LTDAATGALLDSQTIASFGGGVYLYGKLSGHVSITLTNQVGPNVVLNGLFLDPPPTSVEFLQHDTTTQGNWIGTYGSQGYNVIADPPHYPANVTVTPSGASTWVWTTSTTSASALQNPGGSGRIIAGWYSDTSFTVDINLADGQTHNLALYFLDVNNRGRQ